MSDPDRRLATLAALFAPGRASALLARLGTQGSAARAAAHANGLASLARRDRLDALATILASDEARIRASAGAAAAAERGGVATLLSALATSVPVPGAARPLVRLCRERIGR